MICKTFGAAMLFLSCLAIADIPRADLPREIDKSEFERLFTVIKNKDALGNEELLISLNANQIMCFQGKISGKISLLNVGLESVSSMSFFELSQHQLERQSLYIDSLAESLKISAIYEIVNCDDMDIRESVIHELN
ncbi:hypothetical protein ACFO4O_11025 [Glaciecola siphonariae]|uniref:Uncharacterized protein n=1 Tax=Glaciecola siphonariae TaxID=521012 RepID=A0ABV9LXW9_9ALTE